MQSLWCIWCSVVFILFFVVLLLVLLILICIWCSDVLDFLTFSSFVSVSLWRLVTCQCSRTLDEGLGGFVTKTEMKLIPVVLLLLSSFALASPGDNLNEFIECREACESLICQTTSTFKGNRFLGFPFSDVAFPLRLLLWDCESNCDYQCQQYVTQLRVYNHEEIYQFHGKWPFQRIMGTQELASAFFSILNFAPHYLNYKKTLRLYRLSQGSTKVLYLNILIVALVTQGAWLFSTIFHIRDLIVTERLDYFFAGATVLSGFHALTIRVFRLDKNQEKRRLVSIACVLLYLYHFLRLNYDWSYTYNMQANILIALLQYTLFLILAYQHYKKNPRRKSLYVTPVALIASVLFGMSFEVFDFFSLGWQIDAHAIWHATTIVPGFWLYNFFYEDIESLNERYID